MAPPCSVLLDLDGTLIDSQPGILTSCQAALRTVPGGELDHKPELLAHILSEHRITFTHGLMVGDRRYDISGAHAVGMRGVGVLWGYGTRDELEGAGADRLVGSTVDLACTVLAMVDGKRPSA
jgi:phosphoglycolate phosphatase